MNEPNIPISENPYVAELFSILNEQNRDTSGLTALLGHVGEMESFVKTAGDQIAEMMSQIASMKEIQKHPVRSALQSTVKTLQSLLSNLKTQLSRLKGRIVSGAKETVTAFKENGVTALDNIASFFNVKQGLEDWKKDIDVMIRADDKAVAKIEAFSAEYHSATRGLKNMFRVLTGKTPIDAKTENGKLAKALAAPYKAQKSRLISLKATLDKGVASLDRLSARAEAIYEGEVSVAARTIRDRMETAREKQAAQSTSVPAPAKNKGLEVS
jgi:uncharacterized protein (DUF342 family)